MVGSDMKQTEDGLFKALKTMVGNFALHCVWWMSVIDSQQKRNWSEDFHYCCFRGLMSQGKKHREKDS